MHRKKNYRNYILNLLIIILKKNTYYHYFIKKRKRNYLKIIFTQLLKVWDASQSFEGYHSHFGILHSQWFQVDFWLFDVYEFCFFNHIGGFECILVFWNVFRIFWRLNDYFFYSKDFQSILIIVNIFEL